MIKYPEKINKIISDALSTISNQNNIMQCYKAWDKYLSKYFTYPFDAIVTETEESEVFEYGDKISVKRIDSFFDLYGLIVEVRFGRRKYYQQLSNIEASDKKTQNYIMIEAYKEWFDNK